MKHIFDNNIAKPPQASSLLLMDKADNSPRFCTDYCNANGVTKLDAYLPSMEDCVEQLGSAHFVGK